MSRACERDYICVLVEFACERENVSVVVEIFCVYQCVSDYELCV